jgi:hypothetical protein
VFLFLPGEALTSTEDVLVWRPFGSRTVQGKPIKRWEVSAFGVPPFPLRRNSLGMIAPAGENPGGAEKVAFRPHRVGLLGFNLQRFDGL